MSDTLPGRYRRQVKADSALALVAAAVVVLEYLALIDIYLEDAPRQLVDRRGLMLLFSLLSALPLALRRRLPITAALTGHLAHMLVTGLGFQPTVTAQLALLVTFYGLALYVPERLSTVVRVVIAAAMVGWMAVGAWLGAVPPGFILIVALVYAAAWVMGNNARARSQNAELLRERAERAERDQELEAARAVRRERTRIARELHDVIAHNITVMTVQAAGARRILADDPDQALAALDAIEASGRQALNEMRRVIGVMRNDEPAVRLEPQPRLEGLADLFDQIRAGGVRVEADNSTDLGDLPPGVELTVYRVVQEALTNTLKHAGPHPRAWVWLKRIDDELLIEVEDDGIGAALEGGKESTATGHGIVGMQERVVLHGGSLETGPRPGGGFRVTARIPLDARP